MEYNTDHFLSMLCKNEYFIIRQAVAAIYDLL